MSRNLKHKNSTNKKKSDGARKGRQQKTKTRILRNAELQARIDAIVKRAKQSENKSRGVDVLHYESRRLVFRGRATKIG